MAHTPIPDEAVQAELDTDMISKARARAVNAHIDSIHSTLYGRAYDVVQERDALHDWLIGILEKIDANEREIRKDRRTRMGKELCEDPVQPSRVGDCDDEIGGSKLRG